MLFDTQPNTSIDELFGRKAEYLGFINALSNQELDIEIDEKVPFKAL